MTHWFWERLRAEGEVGVRGWDGWTASPMQWTWTSANSGRWWETGRSGVLQFVGLQRVGHDWVTEQQQQWALYGLPQWLSSKESACNARAARGVGRSPGGGLGNPLQYSFLENCTDRGAWQATVHRVTKSQIWLKQLSTHTCMGSSYILESSPLLDIWLINIFSYPVSFLFVFLMMSFEAWEFWILIKSHLLIFSFVDCVLVSYLRNHCLFQCHKDCLYFLWRVVEFWLLHLGPWFWVNFCIVWDREVKFILLHMDIQQPCTICWKDFSFPTE